MHNQKRLKKLLALCLPLLIVLGVAGAISKGQFLKANDSGPALVDLQVNGEDHSDGTFETEEESVNIVLKAKDRSLLELPYNEHIQITPLDESEQEYAYPQIGQADFKKETLLKQFEEANKTEETTNTTETTEEQVPEVRDHDSSLFSVAENDQKGVFYLTMEKDEVRRFKVTRKSTETKEVVVRSVQDNKLVQKLFQFGVTEQELTQAEIPVMDDTMLPEREVVPEEGSEVEQPTSEEVSAEESAGEVSADAVERNLGEPSKTEPFPVNAWITKVTGFDLDTISGPGYDNNAKDDIVRTWDQVEYSITAGISNFDDKYTSLKIRLDMEISGAWRKDSSGQIRQTAEFSNGTLTDTGDGTKKSNRSVWAILENGTTGQAFFKETLNVFGGVNGDKLEPNFRIIIETATTSDGKIEEINQVIDGSVESQMKGTEVYVSAKPLLDVKMTWNKSKQSTFNKYTNTNDRPSTRVTPVATYVQLKPLPGRSDVTSIKGSTYPVGGIKYKIKQKAIYTNDGVPSKELIIGTESDPVQVIKYSGLKSELMVDGHLTNEYAAYTNLNSFSLQNTKAPYGYGMENPLNRDNFKGVYDTGNPIAENDTLTNEISISNLDYKPIEIKGDKYLFGGDPIGSNEKPFSVTAMLLALPYEYLESRGGSLDYTLSISEIEYEGQPPQKVNVTEVIPYYKSFDGNIQAYTAFLSSDFKGLSSLGESNQLRSTGDGVTSRGNNLWCSFYSTFTDPEGVIGVTYGRWNANSFKYDNSRAAYPKMHSGTKAIALYYGVGSNNPNDSLRTQSAIDNDYTWYSSVDEAEKNGEIAAVKSIFEIVSADGYSGGGSWVPLTAVGTKVSDAHGGPNICLANTFNYKDKNMSISSRFSPTTTSQKYVPSSYDDEGNLVSPHQPQKNIWGDTLYISEMTIRPTITTKKSNYSPNETISWTVNGKVESGSENKHKVQFDVIIPKETLYIPGTAKDYQGNPLPDPDTEPIENPDGSWTLRWTLDYMAKGSTYNPTVTFDTSIVSSKLNFVNNSVSVSGKVISEVWLEKDKNIRDTSKEIFRTSTKGVTITNSGVIVVDKRVDKSYIESGNKVDPALPSVAHPTDFTYTVSFKNHSATEMLDVKILDVLPYDDDGRGSKFTGSYSIVDVKQLSGGVSGTIWYTAADVVANRNPNVIDLDIGWHKASSNPAGLKDAKAIMIIYDKLPPGKDMSFTITVRPENQKAGDIYVNAPSLNSHLEQFVQGVASSVRVVGRDLSGVAWYDDSLDGLIGNKPDQSVSEDFAKDIPVKLYRTSLENPDYKNQLVEDSLTGEKFVDSSGNSLIKTDANGKYTFKNLPEGEYVAEFIIDGKIHRVTKQLVGDDVTKNSKADPSNNKTPSYTQPKLNELASVWGQDDSINHIRNVNIGLIRPGTIKLFKYEAGTAIDGNKDGELSDPEKATGKPLKDAYFDLYKGHTGTGTKLGTAFTDENGKLQFNVASGLTENLFPGEYSLVETKAPSGFELLKKPIKVTITQGNQVIQLYQDNDVRTDLPFTGGDNPMLLILLAAASLMTVGFIGMMLYYRQPKRRRHTR